MIFFLKTLRRVGSLQPEDEFEIRMALLVIRDPDLKKNMLRET